MGSPRTSRHEHLQVAISMYMLAVGVGAMNTALGLGIKSPGNKSRFYMKVQVGP